MNLYSFFSLKYIYEWLFINKILLKNNFKRYLYISNFNTNFPLKKKNKNKKLLKFFIFNYFNTTNKKIRNNFFFFFLSNFFKSKFIFFRIYLINFSLYFLKFSKTIFDEGFFYIRGLFILFFIDACLTDDEPLWEPIEWSLIQTWLLFIFIFAWIAENLITSRFGSYTGRDKRIWFAWYKAFWFILGWYIISYGLAVLFVITPFYFEITYNMAFVLNFWNWYTQIFFFKFISIYTIIILLAYLFQLNIRWLNWKKLFFFILIINFFIAYLLYTHFIITFFCYFTDPLWYQKTRFVDYIQLSHEPIKWGWGTSKRDHFTYHKVSTVFWFKNDNPFAGAFLILNMFLFLSIFFLYIYWIVLLRRVYTTKEISLTFATYCVSSLKQFFYFFLFFYFFIFFSFLINYWRFPIEFLWIINSNSWLLHFISIFKDYFIFLFNFFF